MADQPRRTWKEILSKDGKGSDVKPEFSVYDAVRKSYNPNLRQNEIQAKGKFPHLGE
jgi:hypothetical protein